MTLNARLRLSRHTSRGSSLLRAMMVLATAFAFIANGLFTGSSPASAQTGDAATPEAPPRAQQQTGNPGMGTQGASATSATGPGAPAVLAQGLVYLDGNDVVWSVAEVNLPDVADAESSTGDAQILYQRSGSSIVRNDVTAKRAQVDTGAAFFVAANDPYTIFGLGGDEPLAWEFTIGAKDKVASDAFYESPAITDIAEGTYPMSLTRYVLRADEEATALPVTSAALVMVITGTVDLETGGETGPLTNGEGQRISESAQIHNTGNSPAVYVVVALGEAVGDDTAGAPQAPAETPSATEAADDSAATEVPVDETPAAGVTPDDGAFRASINITADAQIYLVVTVDGVTVFDGTLEAGQSTGAIVGSTYTVYTSIGASTLFTDGCGSQFNMGYEPGEVTYTLNATAESCGP